MDPAMRPEVLPPNSPSRPISRAHSTLSEKPTFSKTILSPPPLARPDPAYISPSAASQWVSAELDDDDLSVSEGALALLNSFLDQMLFSFLSSARSTRLPQLRQAVPEVLKPRLGKEAVASADEELREYLGDGDDEELSDFYDGHEPARDFDLELAWKLARLRCMVYTRLGDLEEEDVLEIIGHEQLDERGGQPRRFSSRSNNVTPAGAIFLTSIIEYLGEQALYHAGILAQTRAFNAHPPPPGDSAEAASPHSRLLKGTVIEEIDMRRLGREGPLARIWRNWRRPAWSPQESFSRPLSPSDEEERASVGDTPRQDASTVGSFPLPNIAQTINSTDPAQIPLPMSGNDVDEIEVPGLAREIDGDEIGGATEHHDEEKAKRPNSMVCLPPPSGNSWTRIANEMASKLPHGSAQRPPWGRQRSKSLPPLPQSPVKAREGPTANGDGVAVAPTESAKIDHEAAKSNPTDAAALAADVLTQNGRTSKRHGVAADALSAVPDIQEPASRLVDGPSERNEERPVTGVRGTVASGMLHKPAVEDRIPQSAITAPSLDDAADSHSMRSSQRQQPSVTPAAEEGASGETDPEDLALSSAEDEPQPTKRRSKHDSIPPIQAGSSSDSYSTSPGGNYLPRSQHRDFPKVPSGTQSVAVGPPRQVIQPSSGTYQGVAPSPGPNHQSMAKAENNIAQELPRQLEPKAQTGLPTTAASGPFPKSRLGSTTDSEWSHRSSHSTSSSKLLGYSRDDQGIPLPSMDPEHADLYRMAPADPSRVSGDHWQTPGTATGAAPDVRPGTSGSQQMGAKQPVNLRMSSEEKEAVRRSSFESEAKKRSLELLIQGDETLHYTLTPTSARAPEFPDTIGQIVAPTPDSGDYSKNAASSNQPLTQHQTQPSAGSIRSANGLRAYPLREGYAPQIPVVAASPATTSPRAPTSRPGTSSSKFRHGPARDAKVEASTSRDLADYLRSTGPQSDSQLPQAVVPRPTASTSQPPPAARSGIQPSQSAEHSRSATNAGGLPPPPPPPPPTPISDTAVAGGRPSITATSRSFGPSRHQPRDAQVSKNSTTSALADFIREGPPRIAGDHRISRTVAPFRTTRDSDDLNGLASSTAKDRLGRSSEASTQDSSTVSQSMHSSVNSHTALLDRSKKVHLGAATNGTRTVPSPASSASQSTAQDGMPKRKQRRVRDPYAIDDSDDDIEEVATLKPKRDEESLIDFLRNTAPQPSMMAQPVVTGASSTAPKHGVPKKNSSSAIRDRLRNTNIPGLNRKNSVTATDPPAYSRGSAARAESPHLSQAGSKLDSYKPTQPTHAAHIDRVRSSRANGAVGGSAEHLPNIDQARAARAATMTQDESGFRAFFFRRKSMKQ